MYNLHISYPELINSITQIQDSPPAWTQEPYRPPLIKYSMCCPVPGGYSGYPPPPVLTWLGVGYLGVCAPLAGVPPILTWPGGVPWVGAPLAGVPPSWPGLGGPRVGVPLAGVPPSWPGPRGVPWSGRPLARAPPHLDLARIPPPPQGWTWLGYTPSSWTWLGYSPPPLTPPVGRQMDGWMDRHVWKHYLPVVLRTRSVIIVQHIKAFFQSCGLSKFELLTWGMIALPYWGTRPATCTPLCIFVIWFPSRSPTLSYQSWKYRKILSV